jgi:hypothetical protein
MTLFELAGGAGFAGRVVFKEQGFLADLHCSPVIGKVVTVGGGGFADGARFERHLASGIIVCCVFADCGRICVVFSCVSHFYLVTV